MMAKAYGLKAAFSHLFFGFFSYTTLRQAKIESLTVAFIFRIIQIILLTYIIGWELVFQKGYQSFDTVSSTVTTKVKGFGFTKRNNTKGFLVDHLEHNRNDLEFFRIYDTADYIIPPNEYNSFFVLSNYVQTDQTPGVCSEDFTRLNATCKVDKDCQGLTSINSWNGIPTGRCINSTRNPAVKTCEVNAWCPVEDDSSTDANLINNVLNYTVFIKNDIEFKLFKKKERNILPNITNDYISKCTYHPVNDPHCPVFLLDDALSAAESDPQERANMLRKGGVVQIEIAWNCDYDFYSSQCQPKYSFSRFDSPFKLSGTASGFNFRYADKYKVGDVYYRTLTKAYGLRFIIIITGTAGKFDLIPLLLTVGSGLGLLSISAMIADCYMANFSKHRKFYKRITVLEKKPEEEDSLTDDA